MRINKTTQLFEELTQDEADPLLAWAEDVVLRGDFPPIDPPWLSAWLDTMGYDARQRLLLISTAIPQRVLLSVAHYQRDDARRTLCDLLASPGEGMVTEPNDPYSDPLFQAYRRFGIEEAFRLFPPNLELDTVAKRVAEALDPEQTANLTHLAAATGPVAPMHDAQSLLDLELVERTLVNRKTPPRFSPTALGLRTLRFVRLPASSNG
jgi:hypothetical protein